jgi:hypothetical protein
MQTADRRSKMRLVTSTCTVAVLIATALGAAQAADVYAPPPSRARAVVKPPRYAAVVPVAPVVIERPLGIVTVPQGWAYVVPQPAYQPGHEYVQSPVLLDGRHHRRCWHEWGQLRCAVWGW